MSFSDTDAVGAGAVPRRPGRPKKDNPRAVNQALAATLALSDSTTRALSAIASCHTEEAPAAAAHVTALRAALARTVLDWIKDWPS